MSIRVDQLLHGYRRGHELLAGSLRLNGKDAELVARLSDLSGSPAGPGEFSPYITAYPLTSRSHFAIAKTWPDLLASRSGCVLTHTLLIPIGQWRSLQDPEALSSLFRKPLSDTDDASYTTSVNWPAKVTPHAARRETVTGEASLLFVQLYFASGKRPIVWFDEPDTDRTTWAILRSLWPALRARFSVCTYCLQPRALDDRPFDLMFSTSDVSTRFLRVDRESLIDGRIQEAKTIDNWCRLWARQMFGTASSPDFLERDLFENLDDDPTAIRRLYLINDVLRMKPVAPQSAVGAMDLLESVARQPGDALRTKAEVAKRAVSIATSSSSTSDSAECLRLIEDRLKRPAFGAIADELGPLLATAVADLTGTDPELLANLPPRSYDFELGGDPSWFVKGMVEGFRSLREQKDNRIAALRSLPVVASRLFADDPSAVQAYIEALVTRRAEPEIRAFVQALLTERSAVATRLRQALIGTLSGDDVDLLDEILLKMTNEDVEPLLNKLAPEMASASIQKAILQTLPRSFSKEVWRWASHQSKWSNAMASLAAGTFSATRDGLAEVLDSTINASRRRSLLAKYLQPLSHGRFPAWVRQVAAEDERVFTTLLTPAEPTDSDVDNLVPQLLVECDDLRLAHFPAVLHGTSQHVSRPYYSQLAHVVFSDLVRGYLDGDISEESCTSIIEGDAMSKWLAMLDISELTRLLTHHAWNQQVNWLNAWALLRLMPSGVYQREPSVVLGVIDTLIRAYYQAWSSAVADSWVQILRRSRIESSHTKLALQVQAFRYATSYPRYPLSEVVVETFKDIYFAVTTSQHVPIEASSLFGMWDWDKGKELRKLLIDTFMGSQWPAGDLALASADSNLFRKMFKRIHRKSAGPKYLNAMLSDLEARHTSEANKMAAILTSLLRDPDFFENWD